MFDLTWVGVPATIVGILYFLFIAHKLLPDRPTDATFDRNEFRSYHFELRIPDESSLAGRTVEQAGLRALAGAFLAHIHRDGELIKLIAPDQILRQGDVLAFVGNPQHLDTLLDGKRLIRAVDHPHEAEESPLHLFEAVVAHDSTLVGRSLREIGFRQRFQAIVLGIRRRGERLPGALGRTPIEAGDLLLIEARTVFEAAAWTSGEFSLVSPLERSTSRDPRKAPLVLAVLVAMVIVIATGVIAVSIAAFAAAVAVVAARALSVQNARRSVDLSVLVAIASSFGVAQAIAKTGLAQSLAAVIVQPLEAFGPIAVLAAVYIATNALSEVLSNNAAAALVFPIAAAAATRVGADVLPFAIAVTIAASAAFASPLGYQTYLMIMGPGSYRFRDFVRVGLPLNLVVMAIAIPIIATIWL
jgi:di/tricarboxylate transporter